MLKLTQTKLFATAFDKHLDTIPHGEYLDTINQLAVHCEVTERTIYNWRSGRTHIKKSYRMLIEQFFNVKIF